MWRLILSFCFFLYGVTSNPILNEQNTKVCDDDRCKTAAEIINKSMKKTTDPCDDFYEYACGGWKENFPLPDGEEIWNLDKLTESYAAIETRAILEEEENEQDFAPLKYEKWWYKSCMDTEKIEETGIKPLEEMLEYLGGWPMIINAGDWSDDNHGWQTINEYYSAFKDLSSMFEIYVSADERNSSRNVIEINKPPESLYDMLMDYGNEAENTQKYTEFMKNVVDVFLLTEQKTVPDEQLMKDIEEIVTLESNLRMLKYSANESTDLEPSQEYLTIENLQKFYDEDSDLKPTAKIDWYHVITTMFKSIENVTIDTSEEIGVEDKHYLRKLSNILSETPNRVIVNYIHWKFVSSNMKYTNKIMRDLYNSFFRSVFSNAENIEKPMERWEECIEDMKLTLGHRYEYVRRHFSEGTNKMSIDMANEIRGEMLDEMEHSTWLDDDTRDETIVKLHALKWYMGNSNFFSKKDFLEHFYDKLTITSNYLENVQNAREFFVERNLKRLRHRRNLKKYVRVDPLLATSLYDPARNVLVMTAAQLSVPVVHSSIPLSVNYGYLGPTMSQLMARTLEKEIGSSIYITPWSSYLGIPYQSYARKTECLISQYGNHSIGPSTIDENMYDAIGLKVAYNAFQNSFENENIEKLPELEELSDDQLFFVSFALKYCRTASEKYLANEDTVYSTPNEYRVIVTLSNSEDFAKAFNCPLNSPMNPENKCKL